VNGGPSTDANPIDRIGSLPGNRVSADCTYYIDNKVVVTVPVWDTAGGPANNAYDHIIGFSGLEITGAARRQEAQRRVAASRVPGPDGQHAQVCGRAAGGPADQVADQRLESPGAPDRDCTNGPRETAAHWRLTVGASSAGLSASRSDAW
jgi:hypothetical protein